MTGRIRSIKPELLEDEKTSTLSDTEFRIFVSAILMADDYGNFRGSWSFVAGQAFHSAPHEADREAAFERLISIGLLDRYRVRRQVYLHIHGWERHQRVDKPGKARCPGPAEADQCVPRSRESRESIAPDLRSGSPNPTSESDPERDLRAPDRTPDPLPVADKPTPPKAPSTHVDAPAARVPASRGDDAPERESGASGTKAAPRSPPAVTPEVMPADDFDDDLLDDLTGAAEAIRAWNETRAPEIPPSPTNARGLSSAVLTTIRADRRAEREARKRGDTSPPAVPWLHRCSGWEALGERTHRAAFVRQSMRATAELGWWVHEASRGGESGAIRRERLFVGAWDEIRPRGETSAERAIRESLEAVADADPVASFAGLLGSGDAGRRR